VYTGNAIKTIRNTVVCIYFVTRYLRVSDEYQIESKSVIWLGRENDTSAQFSGVRKRDSSAKNATETISWCK